MRGLFSGPMTVVIVCLSGMRTYNAGRGEESTCNRGVGVRSVQSMPFHRKRSAMRKFCVGTLVMTLAGCANYTA
jgi:hypothetical protein